MQLANLQNEVTMHMLTMASAGTNKWNCPTTYIKILHAHKYLNTHIQLIAISQETTVYHVHRYGNLP